MFTVRGRVISVAPRRGATFGVTLGPTPELFWYVTKGPPPKLGANLTLLAERVADIRHVKMGEKAATLTLVENVKPHPEAGAPDTPMGRVVAPVWFQRVREIMERPLRTYQEEGAAWLASRLAVGVGSILGDDPGSGKTAQTIAAVSATNLFPCVVVATKSLLRNWEREWGYSKLKPTVAIVRKRSGPLPEADVLVLTYQTLKDREADLGRLSPRCLVFDEAHNLKEPRPSNKWHRAAVATRLGVHVRRVVFLTGTPVLNRPEELWRLLHVCEPKAWPDFASYRERYCRAPSLEDAAETHPSERRIVTETGRVEHVDELRTRVEPYLLRRLKTDVMKDLPPKSRNSVLVELDEVDLKQYRAAEKDLVRWLQEQGQELQASRAKRAEALVRLTHLRRLGGEAKLRTAIPEYLRNWFVRKDSPPLIVFAYFRAVCAGIEAIGKALGLRVVSIKGSDDDAKRQEAIDTFQAGHADMFVAPIKAAGVGITLHRASDLLFVERHWVTKELEQAEDRAHRLGQTMPVTVTYLDAADTIDENIARVNASKTVLIDALVDDKRTDGADFAAADEVIRSYVGGKT